MHMFVEFVRICNAGHIESLRSAYESPECRSINLLNDFIWNAVSTCMPSRGDLAGDGTTEFEGLGYEDASSFLEFDKPLAIFSSPNVTVIAILVFELFSLCLGNLDGFQVVNEFNLLAENFFVRIVASEKLRFCEENSLVWV